MANTDKNKLPIKSLGSTFIYQEYNRTLNLDGTVIRMVTEGKILSPDNLSEQIMEMDKRYHFMGKDVVINDCKNGKFKLLYNNKNYRLPNTIPAFLINTGSGISCVVNISNHAKEKQDGTYVIDTKTLYTLMQAGSILVKCVETNKKLTYVADMAKFGSACYSKMFVKVLNKMFSININPQKHDIMVFLSSMFFLVNVLGRNDISDVMNNNYALANCKDINKLVIDDAIRNFDNDDFKNIDTFIKAIAEKVPGLSDLTTRGFMDAYMTNFGPTTLLGLEYLPIFLYNIFAIIVGAFINNQHALESLLGKDIDSLAKTFFRIE